MPKSFELLSYQPTKSIIQIPGDQLEYTKLPPRCEALLALSGVPASKTSFNRKVAYAIGISSISWHVLRNLENIPKWGWKDFIHPSWESRTPISTICKILHGTFGLYIARRIRDHMRLDPKSYKVLHLFSLFLLIGWVMLRILELVIEINTGKLRWWELIGVICPGFFHEVPRLATISLFALACETLHTRKRQFLAAVAASTSSAEVNYYYDNFLQQVLDVSGFFEFFLAIALTLELIYFVSLLLMRPGSHSEGIHIFFVMFKVVGTAVMFLGPAASYNTKIFFAADNFATERMKEKSLVEGPQLTALTLMIAKPAFFRIAYFWNPTLMRLLVIPTSLILTRALVPKIVEYIRETNFATTTLTTTSTLTTALTTTSFF